MKYEQSTHKLTLQRPMKDYQARKWLGINTYMCTQETLGTLAEDCISAVQKNNLFTDSRKIFSFLSQSDKVTPENFQKLVPIPSKWSEKLQADKSN